MPKRYIAVLLFLFAGLYSHSQDLAYPSTPVNNTISSPAQVNQTVYMCTGAYAYSYHSTPNCPGLGNCKSQVVYLDANTAVYTYGRKPCCRCWNNPGGDCKDDASSGGGTGGGGGGGGDGSGYIIAGVVIASASAIILSNDVYFYPVAAVKNGPIKNQTKHFGWAFGLRKTFPNAAIEYGVSTVNEQWGYHASYVHSLFMARMPERLTIYAGPALNFIDEFGYGGLVGTSYQLLKRLKVDLRYEYTTQTNNLKLGFIFNYQRKYFWQR